MARKRKLSNKQAILLSVVIVGLMLVISFINMGIDMRNSYDLDNNAYMFESLADLSFLDEYAVEKELTDQNKTIELLYDGETYAVSAFVFESKESAWACAKRISGNDYQKLNGELGNINFRYSQTKSFLGLFVSRKTLIVSDNKLLLIEGKSDAKEYAAFLGFVMEHLSLKVDFTK